MNYNTIIDFWFSYALISMGIPFALFALVLIYREKLYGKKEYKPLWFGIYQIIPIFLIFAAALINPIYWGYGNPRGIEEIKILDGQLYVVDYIRTMNTRAASGDNYDRVHILDPQTGAKKIRFSVGDYGLIVGLHGDSLAISRYNLVAYYSISDGHNYVTYNRKTLPDLFPQLSMGIDNIMWADNDKVMEIETKDGKKWLLYTQTRMLYPAKPNGVLYDYVPTHKLYIHGNDIRRDDRDYNNNVISLYHTSDNQNLNYIANAHDSILNHDLVFIGGVPLAINNKDSSFVILSYETTDKQKFILTCMSFDGKKKLWEVRQSSLNPKYISKKPEEAHVGSDDQKGLLFVNVGVEIISMDMKDGKVIWRTNL